MRKHSPPSKLAMNALAFSSGDAGAMGGGTGGARFAVCAGAAAGGAAVPAAGASGRGVSTRRDRLRRRGGRRSSRRRRLIGRGRRWRLDCRLRRGRRDLRSRRGWWDGAVAREPAPGRPQAQRGAARALRPALATTQACRRRQASLTSAPSDHCDWPPRFGSRRWRPRWGTPSIAPLPPPRSLKLRPPGNPLAVSRSPLPPGSAKAGNSAR